MKIAWVSAPAHARTGYGKQTKEIVSRLIEKYDVITIGGGTEAVWGGKIFIQTETGKQFPVLPTMGPLGGRSVVPHYERKYKFDLIITFWDCFAVNYAQHLTTPVVHYFPIDAPFTRKMYDDVKHGFKLVAYSRFGYRELLKWFPPSKINYVPHGVNTTVFKPQPEKVDRKTRENLFPKPVPDDAFLITHVGANVGERKHIPQLMLVFKKLLEQYKDVYLYIYGNVQAMYPKGYDLLDFARQLGIYEHLRFPSFNPILEPAEDEEMTQILSTSDLYASASMGEGYGLPIGEAQSTGTPCAVPKNSAQTELVEGHGWLADNIPTDEWLDIPVWIPTLQRYPLVNMKSLLSCLKDAYENRDKLREYGKKSRKFMIKNYSWNVVMPKWFSFLDETEEDLELFKAMRPHLVESVPS